MDGTALDIAMGNHDPDVNETAARGAEAPPSACPPVVEYNSAEQARVAREVTALHLDTLTVDWLADYPVLRDSHCGKRQVHRPKMKAGPVSRIHGFKERHRIFCGNIMPRCLA